MIYFDGVIQVYPHILEGNQQIRKDQIIKLYNSICTENPITIDVKKITGKILTINLAWVLAFVRRGYKSFGDIDFADSALNSMAQAIIDQIHQVLMSEQHLNNKEVKFKCVDEPHLILKSYMPSKLCYLLPPEISTSLLKNHFNFSLIQYTHESKKSSANPSGKQAIINIAVTNLTNITNHIDNSSTSLYQIEGNVINNFQQKNTDKPGSNLENSGEKAEQNNEAKNVKINKNDIIKSVLEKPLIKVIKDINPCYAGNIHSKTSAPHKLVIRVIAMMVKLKIQKDEITWQSIHPFIEENIYQHNPFKDIAGLEEINEDEILVSGIPIAKRNCQNKIARYKKEIFSLS